MTIKAIFDEIAAEPGSNKKMEILGRYKDNWQLKRALYLANSKRIKFFIKQIPAYTPKAEPYRDLEAAMAALNSLITRIHTGANGIEHLRVILESCTPDDAYIIERIIEKDCKIGMGTSNINKIFPKLIEKTPYMGAVAFEEKLLKSLFEGSRSAIIQVKMDGRYCNAIIRGGEVELESRQGEPTLVDGALFLKELATMGDCVLNGELTMDGVSRYESNGLIASCIDIGKKKADGKDVTKEITKFEKEKGMTYQKALDSIRYTVWDSITVEEYFDNKSMVKYVDRLSKLATLLSAATHTMVTLIEFRVCKTYGEAMSYFQELLARGDEGAIAKAVDGGWKDGKPNWQVKMKLEMDVDLKIVGFNYGTGKNSEVISSVNAESADGLVFTRPTGINEATMAHVTANQDKLLGTILEVKCSGLSQNSNGKYSLLHPVFKTLRDDKDTCDTLESIKAIEAMAKELK